MPISIYTYARIASYLLDHDSPLDKKPSYREECKKFEYNMFLCEWIQLISGSKVVIR